MTELVYPSLHLDRQTALNYGMPHIGCAYTRDDVMATAFDDDWVACACCGKTATNRHHEPPRSRSRAIDPLTGKERPGSLLLTTRWGQFVLKPALIALCGSGTTGCHAKRHNGLLEAQWRFDADEYEDMWLDGYMLSHLVKPHSEKLYGYGCWQFEDRETGRVWTHRGGGY